MISQRRSQKRLREEARKRRRRITRWKKISPMKSREELRGEARLRERRLWDKIHPFDIMILYY